MSGDRELDKQIAERVMGWVDFWSDREGVYLMGYPPNEQAMGIEAERAHVPHYSTEIGAAWTVVEYLHKQYDCAIDVKCLPSFMPAQRYGAMICGGSLTYDRGDLTAYGHSNESAAHAICLAALKALRFKA